MRVYLVTEGSYADYRVLGVYSSEKLAEEAAKLLNSDNCIEDFDLDHIPPPPSSSSKESE